MDNDRETVPRDVPLYCERCRRVTVHYLADPPYGDKVWICSECALIDVLVEVRTLTPTG